MIVAGPEGLIKGAYRKFNIRGLRRSGAPTLPSPAHGRGSGSGLTEEGAGEVGADACPRSPYPLPPLPPRREIISQEETSGSVGGDDYAMMREVLLRRFARAVKEDPERERGGWPDLVLIDGGQGQLNTAYSVLDELGIADVAIVGIAKGPDRNAGRERFFMVARPPFSLDPRDSVLYFLQRLRDEAHRFAIGTHRARRAKAIGRSPLDEIGGIGPRRKQALLHHFGSARAVARAGLGELERVTGISKTVAKKIYDHFHADG